LQQRSTWRAELLPGAFDMGAALADAQRALLHAASDAQELVRTEAAGALGMYAAPETAEALVNLALADSSEMVREAATGALAQSPIPHVGRLLAGALEDAGEQRRARAVEVLAVSGGPGTGRFILEALHDPAASVRTAALAALARSQASAPAESLIAELRNPDARIRATVAARLGRERSPECGEALAQALGDPEEEVRVNAISALAGMGRLARKHEGAMTARLTDPSSRVREAAAAALRALRASWVEGPETTQILREGPLSPETAANLVEVAINGDMSPFLRAIEGAEAAQSLVAYLAGVGRGKLKPLLSALRHADERDQAKALPALSQALRKAGTAGEYLAELKALDSGVRLMAVEVAGMLGTPEATAGLMEALARDPLPEVRSRAASTLAGVPGDAVRAALVRAQENDPNEVVRLVAARSLGRARSDGESVPVLPTTEETPSLDSVQGGAR
jgi:HEAT repeat protein